MPERLYCYFHALKQRVHEPPQRHVVPRARHAHAVLDVVRRGARETLGEYAEAEAYIFELHEPPGQTLADVTRRYPPPYRSPFTRLTLHGWYALTTPLKATLVDVVQYTEAEQRWLVAKQLEMRITRIERRMTR